MSARLLHLLATSPWALHEPTLQHIARAGGSPTARRANGARRVAADQAAAAAQTHANAGPRAVAIILIRGVIDQHDWVYVHDAARPGIDAESLLRLSARLEHETCGALLCIPMADTVKRVDPVSSLEASAEYRSGGTVDRSRLWLAQTPQVFRAGTLRRALLAHPTVTDEAAAIEAEGGRPLMVNGSRRNLKITTIEDLIMLRVMMGRETAA